jgi:hypothetical protein
MNDSPITFGPSDPPLSAYETIPWQIGEHHSVEFFSETFFDVVLISTSSPDLSTILNSFPPSQPLAIDLEWNDEINLLQFADSHRALLIHHPEGPGHPALKKFLKSHKFYGKGMHNDRQQLFHKFGDRFSNNMEDIAQTRLKPHGFSENFVEMTLKFAGVPCADFKGLDITKADWELNPLPARQVLYAAFDVVALVVAYPHFLPPVQAPKPRQMVVRPAKPRPEGIPEPKSKGPKLNEKVVQNRHFREVFCYLCENFEGDPSPPALREQFPGCDFVGTIKFQGRISLVLALLQREIINGFVCQELPQLPEEEATENDIFYLQNIPPEFASQQSISTFLYAFGYDQVVTFQDNYCRVEPRNVRVSYRIQSVLPYLRFGGTPMSLSFFPFFLPKVRISNLPSETTEDSLRTIMPDLSAVEILRCRRDGDSKTAILTFETCERADEIVELWNYEKLNNQEIFVTRFADEAHLRELRKSLVFVTGFTTHRELRSAFCDYGPILQAIQSERFSIGQVQFLRWKDATKAVTDHGFFSDPLAHVSIRDLSLAIPENDLISVISQYGTIFDLTFRDMSDIHVVSVADVIYSEVSAANACKEGLNNVTLGDSTLHVSRSRRHQMPDWKMSQRNQWVRLADLNDFDRCSEFGRVINWSRIEDTIYVMFENVDDVTQFIQTVGGTAITNREFVEKTGNDDLEIKMTESVSRPTGKPQTIVIEIDPLPTDFEIENLSKICQECQDCDIYEMPSLTNPELFRALIYPGSKRMSVKIYTQLYNTRIDGQLLRPRRLKAEDIKDPPIRKENPLEKYGLQPIIVIDPAPPALTGKKLTDFIEPIQNVEFFEERSAVVRGERRLIFKTKHGSERKQLNHMLLNTMIDDEALKVQLIKPAMLSEPLPE